MVDARRVSTWARKAVAATAAGATMTLGLGGVAQADPLWPGGPDIPGVPMLFGATASVSPGFGEVVGGKRAIVVRFTQPVFDRVAAENSVQVWNSAGAAGHFEWLDALTLQYVPNDYWPRGTAFRVDAQGAHSAFTVASDFTTVGTVGGHRMRVSIGGDVVRDMPASYGKPGHDTPRGTFPILAKERTVVMDSSTYGVPITAPEGYRVTVDFATRLTWDGIYVHSAPWSLGAQGNDNVSHGCINLSPENAEWFQNNVGHGDVVTITN